MQGVIVTNSIKILKMVHIKKILKKKTLGKIQTQEAVHKYFVIVPILLALILSFSPSLKLTNFFLLSSLSYTSSWLTIGSQ